MTPCSLIRLIISDLRISNSSKRLVAYNSKLKVQAFGDTSAPGTSSASLMITTRAFNHPLFKKPYLDFPSNNPSIPFRQPAKTKTTIASISARVHPQNPSPPQIKIMAEPIPKDQPWHTAFPAVRATPREISAEEVMKLFDDMDITPRLRSFLLVDVRREDWVVSPCLSLYIIFLLPFSFGAFDQSGVKFQTV